MPGSTLPNLGLTGDIIDGATWGTEGRANDRRLDSLIMAAVTSVLSAQPGSPSNGDRYIIGASPSGAAWTGNANSVAVWNANLSAWNIYAPKTGWIVYVASVKSFLFYTGTVWANSGSTVNVKQFGAVGDGTTDDEPVLNAMFDFVALLSATGSLTQGPATVYFPKGTYYIKSSLVPDGESLSSPISGLRIVGDSGTIIKAATIADGGTWTANSACLAFRASTSPATDVVIEGLIFDGQSFGTTSHVVMGIYTTAVTGFTVRNCTFKNIGDTALGVASSPRNDGILLGDIVSTSSARAKDVRIEKCRFVNCVRNGISMLDVDGVVVDSCYFENMDNSGIDIEPNAAVQYARDIKITNCTFSDWIAQAVSIIPGSSLRASTYAAQMEGIKVIGCYMDGATTGNNGVLVYNWIDADVSNNTVLRTDDVGIYVVSSLRARVHSNHVRDVTTNNGGILVDKTGTVQPQDISINGNMLKNMSGYGIRLVDVDTGCVIGNTLRVYDSNQGGRGGISVATSTSTCKNISVVGNTVTGGDSVGLGRPIAIATACTRVLVVGNLCQDNGVGAANDSIDNDATSTVQGYNCDDQRSTRLFTGSGNTPHTIIPVGQTANSRRMAMEVTVTAGAGPGPVSVTNDLVNSGNSGNVIFSPINVAAAAMAGSAVGVYCARTPDGFDLIHNGNGAGTDAIFQCMVISA